MGLEAAGLEVFCPFERRPYRVRGIRYIKVIPVFSRYIFVRCEPDRIGRLKEIEGVEDILRGANNVVEPPRAPKSNRLSYIPDEVIEVLRRSRDMGAFDYTGTRWVQAGEDVEISSDSALAGLLAKIKSRPRNRRIELVGDFPFRLNAPLDKIHKIKA